MSQVTPTGSQSAFPEQLRQHRGNCRPPRCYQHVYRPAVIGIDSIRTRREAPGADCRGAGRPGACIGGRDLDARRRRPGPAPTVGVFAALSIVELFLFANRPGEQQHAGRALSESTKSLTWRLAIIAHPFPGRARPLGMCRGIHRPLFTVGRLMSPRHRPVTLVGHSGAAGTWLFHCPNCTSTWPALWTRPGGRPSPSGSWRGA
ncbi:hypothetical protein [Micromonospora taraxaci]